MFGAGVVIRDYRVAKNKKDEGMVGGSKAHSRKSGEFVRVYRMNDIERTLGLDREALICFVLLNCGDYDPTGLRNCGPKLALTAARSGLGRGLRSFQTEFALGMWRALVAEYFQGKRIVPPDFARNLHVKRYCHPKVTPLEQLHSLRCLQRGWNVPFDEEKVRDFISKRFNIWTKGYMDWIGPILLVRSLLLALPLQQTTNKYDIKLTRRRKKQAEGDAIEDSNLPETEVKLTFLATSVTSLDYDAIDDGHWLAKVGIPPDLDYRPECEVLDCFLRGRVPDEVFALPAEKEKVVKDKKRKAEEAAEAVQADGPSLAAPGPVKKRKSASQEEIGDGDRPRKRGRPPKKAESNIQCAPPVAAASVPIDPPEATFRLPTSIAALRELSSLEDNDDELVFVGQRCLVAA